MATTTMQSIAVHDSSELLAAAGVIDRLLVSFGGGNSQSAGVLTSRDPGVISAKEELTNLVSPHFDGVTRWFVPVAPILPMEWTGRFSAYTTYLSSGAIASPRTLDTKEVGALKIIVSGSIKIQGNDQALTQGDWVWLPSGGEYSLQAEDAGATLFTMLPCVEDTTDINKDSGLPNELVNGTFITSRDAYVQNAQVRLDHLERHFETAQEGYISHKSFPFAPRLFHAQFKQGTEPGRFWAWLANIAPGTEITPHFHESENLADVKLVISGSISANGQELTAGDWFWAPAEGPYSFTAGEHGALIIGSWPHNAGTIDE
jgi:quercetin dioxygenase-like cupin family protein